MADEVIEQLATTEDIADETDELAELLAERDAITTERFNAITEGVTECRTLIQSLATQMQAENPLTSQILTAVMELQAKMESQLADMRSSLTKLETQAAREPSPSPQPETPPVPPTTMESEEPVPGESTGEQRPEETPTVPETRKTARFDRL